MHAIGALDMLLSRYSLLARRTRSFITNLVDHSAKTRNSSVVATDAAVAKRPFDASKGKTPTKLVSLILDSCLTLDESWPGRL